jgi:hypothetical protein
MSLYLDENDPESTYDWVFDSSNFKDTWDGCTGRLAALKTLKSWHNLDLHLYVANKETRGGETVTEFSTLKTRVIDILHSLEILMDSQEKIAYQDGIMVSQALDPRKSITGFDVLDVVAPFGSVHPRMHSTGLGGGGWIDLAAAAKITTLFGRGFGDLIRPNKPSFLCPKWTTVPIGLDYMAASVCTLGVLHGNLAKKNPNLSTGELTKKLVWSSPPNLHSACKCRGGAPDKECPFNPVHFLIPKMWWRPSVVLRSLEPVDIAKLDEKGAHIFEHAPWLKPGNSSKDVMQGGEDSGQLGQSVNTPSLTSSQNSPAYLLNPSAVVSANSSVLTPQTSVASAGDNPGSADEMGDASNAGGSGGKRGRTWKRRLGRLFLTKAPF